MERIRLIATSDIHGEVFPWNYADGRKRNSGLARIRNMIRVMKDENTVVIDNGDSLQGSPLSFYHYTRHPEEISPVTKAMHAIGYDYVNLGNHDFDYGTDALFRHLENCSGTCLTANVLYEGTPIGRRYDVRDFDGVKVAFFALTTHRTPDWEPEEDIRGLTFLNAFDTAKEIVAEIKEKESADYIVCIYHGSFERDLQTGEPLMEDTGENQGYRILKEIPGIDIMISGHQHLSINTTAFDTTVTQTIHNAREVAVIDIDDDGIEAWIVPVLEAPDKELMEMLSGDEKGCQEWLDQPLGTCENDLQITDEFEDRLHKSQVITFLNHVQREVTGADLSASSLFIGSAGFRHTITMRDLVTTYVFPNTLCVKKIDGRLLKEFLEKCAEFWDIDQGKIVISPAFEIPTPMYFNYEMVDGIEYTIKVSEPVGQRIVSLTKDGRPVRDDDTFTLCIDNYRAAGGGGFDMLKGIPDIYHGQTSMVEILATYIMEHQNICFEEQNNIQVIV